MRLGSATLLKAPILFAAPEAFTRPLPDGTIFLDVGREQVEAELRLFAAQFEIGFGKPVPHTSRALSAGLRRDIARHAADRLTASHRDGPVSCTEVRDVATVMAPSAGHSHLYVKAALLPPSPATPGKFEVRTYLICKSC